MILSVCDSGDVLSTFRIVKIAITIIKIAVPIILIVTSMINYMHAVSNGDNDALSKANKNLVSKVIAALLVFFIPTFINIIADATSNSVDFMKCISNANSEGISNAYASEADNMIEAVKSSSNKSSYNLALASINKIDDEGLKNSKLKKLDTYKKYIDINEEFNKLSNSSYNTKENRKKVTDMINSLSDSDPKKKEFLDRLSKLTSSSSGEPLNITTGYKKYSYNGLTYFVYFPPEATTNMPLLIWLHGDNPRVEWSTNVHIGPTAYKAGVPAILVIPFAGSDFGSSGNPGWAEGGLLPKVKEIADLVCDSVKCNKDNINVGGHSRGAIGTWMMVSKYPGYFHAASPVSCCSIGGFNPSSFTGVKVWAFRGSNAGTGDNNDNIYAGCMKSTIDKVRPYAKEVRYTIEPNTTHGDATNKMQVSEDYVRFMFTD